ncbi:hypothetical protein BGZ58_002854, partial [Dissophora ornata]
MASVAEFSRQVSQRLHSPTAALTGANLYRHTVMNPTTGDEKLMHILAFVEKQRELIALEEETHQSTTDKGHRRNTLGTNNPTKSDLTLELHSSQKVSPHHRPLQQQEHLEEQPQHKQQFRLQDPPALAHKRSKQNARQRTPPLPLPPPPAPAPVSASAPTLYQPLHHPSKSQRHINYVPDGLDPSMALPRALPRSKIHQNKPLYRDSFYTGIGQDSDWRQLEELDPELLARIHLHGDTCDLQHQQSPASPSSPLEINEYSSNLKNADWQQERRLQRQQQQSIHRQLQCADDDGDDDEFGEKMATRHHRQHPISPARHYQQQYQKQHQEQQQPHLRQLASPTLTFVEKEKKARLSSRFSFLTRGRKGQHQRHESVPNTTKEIWSPNPNGGHARVHSVSVRPGSQATAVFGSEMEQGPGDAIQPRSGTPTSKRKSNSRMKQMLKDVFSMSSRRRNSRSPETPFRDISLPSTHIRSTQTPSPQLHHHQQHLDPYSAALAQRKGLVTPTSRPGTSQSFHLSDTYHNSNYGKGARNPRESLVDPIQPQAFQRIERSDLDDLQLADVDQNSILWSPFVQTSLTPPPVSPLRHSTSSHRVFGTGSREYEPVFISAAATANELIMDPGTNEGGKVRPKTRPSSQLMPIPKDLVDSGCDSMGGHEHCATASNATTLNHNQSNALGHQPNPNQAQFQQKQPTVSSYDHGREITVSAYENGPTILSMAQVHKVDLEGLGQSHQHHSPPYSRHLSM